MNAFFASIGHNLRRLADFSGRETQIQFFPYACFIYGLSTVVSTVITMMPLMTMFMGMMQQIAAAGPDAPPDEVLAKLAPLGPDFSGIALPIAVINVLIVLLLASAVARRLHDKDRSGLWGLVPLPFMTLSVVLLPYTMPSFDVASTAAPSPIVAFASLNSILYFGVFVLLVVLLIGKGTAGPNRFGPEAGIAA